MLLAIAIHHRTCRVFLVMMHLPFDLPDRVGALDYPDLAWYAND